MVDFLSSFFGTGGGAQGVASSFLNPLFSAAGNAVTQALFGRQDRISNRDYQFYQDLADSGNPREIARQNQFLEGVTPTNAAQYNKYQDLTFQEDTDRQLDRIDDISKATRMSPWEIAGVGGATPLPSGDFGPSSGGGEATRFLSQLTPLKIAEMNNATQLQATAMNNQTAKEINNQNTAGGELPKIGVEKARQDIAASVQGMSESQSRQTVMAADVVLKGLQGFQVQASTDQTRAQTSLTKAQEALTGAQKIFLEGVKTDSERAAIRNTNAGTDLKQQELELNKIRMQLAERKDLRDSIALVASIAPSETWEIPGGTTTQIMDGAALVELGKLVTEISASNATMSSAEERLKGMNDVELSAALKAAAAASTIVKDVAGVRSKNAVTNAANQRTYGP